jgi:ribonuclease T
MTEYSLVSVDIETTGPSPSVSEMCSIGAVYLDADLEIADIYFSANLEFPPAAAHKWDDATMDWWKQWPEQWEAHRTNPQPVIEVMQKFADFLDDIVPGRPLFVAWPVGFDWGFVNDYFHDYLGRNPFGYSPLCLKNYAAGVLRNPGMLMGNREEAYMPDGWHISPESLGLLPHIAINDAIAQAHMIRNIMRWTG